MYNTPVYWLHVALNDTFTLSPEQTKDLLSLTKTRVNLNFFNSATSFLYIGDSDVNYSPV